MSHDDDRVVELRPNRQPRPNPANQDPMVTLRLSEKTLATVVALMAKAANFEAETEFHVRAEHWHEAFELLMDGVAGGPSRSLLATIEQMLLDDLSDDGGAA